MLKLADVSTEVESLIFGLKTTGKTFSASKELLSK